MASGIVRADAALSMPDSGTTHIVMEAYPSDVLASKQAFNRQVSSAAPAVTSVPFYLIVPTIQRWSPGQTVRVAFKGGDIALYAKIAGAASAWITKGGANLKLSFTDDKGQYRAWTEADAKYAGEIRIAFDGTGYWSHIGTDAVNRNLVGGMPGQRSMNLQGFDGQLPQNWETVVIHEFGHALGFEHEHQNPAGGCDFRFEDDAGYIPTKDAAGWFIIDDQGRRPGLYTYLSGYKNFWPREHVDANLRALPTSSAFSVGPFDKSSVMKYFFLPFMFIAGEKSSCYSEAENTNLSAQDIVGVRKAYPSTAATISAIRDEKRALLEQLQKSPVIGPDFRKHLIRELQEF